jgi:hypothetical protein
MQRRIIIRGTVLGGYPFVLMLVALVVLTPVSVWLYPAELVRWLDSAVIILIGLVILIGILRRTVVEIQGERIRWFFRQPQDRGEEGVGNLRLITLYPESGALLEFAGGRRLMIGIGDFRNRDIIRVVETLRGLGVAVDDSTRPRACMDIQRGPLQFDIASSHILYRWITFARVTANGWVEADTLFQDPCLSCTLAS